MTKMLRAEDGRRWLLAAVVALVAMAVIPTAAQAQTETGRVVGVVTDQSGGVLPGATVTLKAIATGATRSTVSDAGGSYTFVGLLPGAYEVSIELAGFSKKQYKTNLTVGGSVAVNARLEVGQQTEVVTVVAEEGAQINTTTQEVSTTVTSQQLRELPTLTRNPYDLVTIAGNVAPSDVNNVQVRGANSFNLNGQRNASTNILLDGSANNDEYTASVGQQVPLDAVQEFSVITSNFSAQYGRASGGIVNVATKSGSNEWHGSASEYYRPSSLSANDFDANARGQAKADFKRHQPGGSLGGPLVKDKVFFFASYEYTKVDSTAPTHFAVPTQDLLNLTPANVQQFFAGRLPSANGGTISVAQVCQQFGCDAGGPFAALPGNLPAFGIVNGTAPVDGGAGAQQTKHTAVGRLDFNLSPSTTAYLRYALEKRDFADGFVSLSPYPGFSSGEHDKRQNMLASVTHTFSPNLTSQTKAVYNNLQNEQPLGSPGSVPALYLTGGKVSLLGNLVEFPGYFPSTTSVGIPSGGPQKLLQFYQDFDLVKGKHDIRFGGSYVRIMDDRTFGAYQTAIEVLTAGTPIEGLNNFMTGDLDSMTVAINPKVFPGQGDVQLPASQGASQFTRNNRYNEWAAYANDSWSVTSRLKVNLGVRWEVFGVQHNTDPTQDSNFYFGQGDNFFQQFRNGSLALAPDSPIGQLWANDRNNVAPRVGFAWDVNGDGKTSIRGGYGIGFERNFGNVTFNMIQNPPNNGTAQIFGVPEGGSPAVRVTTDNLGALGQPGDINDLGGIAFSLRHVDQNIKTAYAHFWSASFQRQLTKNTLVSIDYTGSKGVGLYSLGNINARGTAKLYANEVGLDQATTSARARLNPLYGSDNMRTNNGKSLYNGVTFGIDGHDIGGSGLSVTGRYTWSKAKDNLSTTFSEGISGNTQLGFLDPFVGGVGGGPDLDYGWADFDVRHRFSGSAIWEVPLARGSTGATKALLNGWSVTGIVSARSGLPFPIYDCSNSAPAGAIMCMRMLQVAPVTTNSNPASSGDPNTFKYIDLTPQASGIGTYINPITGSSIFGPFPANMTQRNQFRGPGNWNVDAVLAKRFNLTDKVNLQFRFEAYNVFNHPNMYVDGSTLDASSNQFVRAWRGGNPALGLTDHRNVQVALRLNF
jgi:carboxypeptidase family protein/TonB-dependent receptor-like protein